MQSGHAGAARCCVSSGILKPGTSTAHQQHLSQKDAIDVSVLGAVIRCYCPVSCWFNQMCEIKLPDKFNEVVTPEPDGLRSSLLILCVSPLVHQVVSIFHLMSHPADGARVTTTA